MSVKLVMLVAESGQTLWVNPKRVDYVLQDIHHPVTKCTVVTNQGAWRVEGSHFAVVELLITAKNNPPELGKKA